MSSLGYRRYPLDYFLLFFIKNPSANNNDFIYFFDKLKMKERYEAML